MTKLWIAFATALVAVTYSSGADAYGIEPAYTVLDAAVMETQPIALADACVLRGDPELSQLLALPADLQIDTETTLACVQE